MPRLDPRLLARLAAFALIGASVGSIGVRPASAMGCHVESKPALGLSDSWDELTNPNAVRLDDEPRPLPRLARMPCPADLPGALEHFGPAAPADRTPGPRSADEIRPIHGIEADPIGTTRHLPTSPDRPPRP